MKKFISMVMSLVLMLSLVPSALAADSPRVVLSSQRVLVNGVPTEEMSIRYSEYEEGKGNVSKYLTPRLEVYNINGSNYFKLRDIAMLLSNTDCAFIVSYKWGQVRLSKFRAYERVGGECEFDGVDKSSKAVKSSNTIMTGGEEKTPEMYNIGGNNFIKLRDVISYLPYVTVDWDSATNSVLITTIEKLGTLEDQKAYARECVRLLWGEKDYNWETEKYVYDFTPYNAAVTAYNELLNTGKINHSMSKDELESVFKQWLYQFPSKGITYSGFKHEDGFEGIWSVFVDHYALSDVSYEFALRVLMDIEYAETLRDDIKPHTWGNYAHQYRCEHIN